MEKEQLRQELLKHAQDGKIDASELKELLMAMGTEDTRTLNEKEAQDIIDDFDDDDDGNLNIDEMVDAWALITNPDLVAEATAAKKK